MASRHLSRMAALQALFSQDVRGSINSVNLIDAWKGNIDSLAHGEEDEAFTKNLLDGVAAKQYEIDKVIEKSAPQWPLSKIAIIDRNILRIGLFELLYLSSDVPPKVALNESIELAKTFGGDSSPKFINGVLGAVYRDIGSPRKDEAPSETKNVTERSAGAVTCSKEKGEFYVAMILDPFDKWTVPKSKIKEGELSEAAAERAIKDELGLKTVTVHSAVGEHEYTAHDPKGGPLKRSVGYFVACAPKVPLISKKSKSIKEVRWFSEADLMTAPIYEDLRTTIERGLEIAKEKCE